MIITLVDTLTKKLLFEIHQFQLVKKLCFIQLMRANISSRSSNRREDSDPDFVKVIGRSNLDLRGPKPQGYPVRFILHMMKMALYTFMEKMKILVNI